MKQTRTSGRIWTGVNMETEVSRPLTLPDTFTLDLVELAEGAIDDTVIEISDSQIILLLIFIG